MPSAKLTRERVEYLANILKESGGELTDAARALFEEKFGAAKKIGQTARAARRLLGLEPGKAPAEAPVPSELREALNMIGHVEKIQASIAGIEVQIEGLEARRKELAHELETYKPVLAHLRALSLAVGTVRAKAAEVAR